MTILEVLLGAGPSGGVDEANGSMTLLVVYAVVAIGFSFLCSIAEAVLLSVTPSHIATLKTKGKRSGRQLEKLKENIDRPLAAILSLNTIAHTVGAAGVGAEAASIWGSNFVGLVSAIMTLLILVLSEIIPKTIGAVYWRTLAPWMARVVQVLILILLPLVWLSDRLTKLISGKEKQDIVTRDEVAAMVNLSAAGGQLDTGETRILQNLFRLGSLTAHDIMTPRTVIIAFPQEMTVEQVLEKHPELSVSRIPIYEGSIDRITGMVLKSDILLSQARGESGKTMRELRRDVRTVADSASLKRLLDLLLGERQHMAVVVDKYGGTDGIVTLEDLIETLLGVEIVDEADATINMRKLARRQWQRRVEALGLDSLEHGVEASSEPGSVAPSSSPEETPSPDCS